MSSTNGNGTMIKTKPQTHVLSVLVENHHGVLSRVSGLFAMRGFNIDSLTVGTTQDPSISRMTVAVTGDGAIVDQIEKQLNKMVEVITVKNLTATGLHIERELMLVKVTIPQGRRTELLELITIFKAKTTDITTESLTVEISGGQDKLGTFLEMIMPFGILELARTGVVGLTRGAGGLHTDFENS